jgi:hypothetical protein
MAVTLNTPSHYWGANFSSSKVDRIMPGPLTSVSTTNRVALATLREAIAYHKSPRSCATPFGTPMDTPDGTTSRGGASSAGSFTSCGTPGTEFPHVE